MSPRRSKFLHMSAFALFAIAADMSFAKNDGIGKESGISGADCPSNFAGNFPGNFPGNFHDAAYTGKRSDVRDQLTISQPPHDIMPLNDVLAEIKPHECGSLVGVRLMQHRALVVYRLRILKDTGGVIDLYVNARTGGPL